MKALGTTPITTSRLTLRRFQKGDELMMFINYCADAEVTKYLSWSPHANIEVTATYLTSILEKYQSPNHYQWAIIEKSSQQLIGAIDLVSFDIEKQNGEIGYVLGQKFWNQGYMSEALRAVTEYCFEKVQLQQLNICAHHQNIASQRVQEKCGYHFLRSDIRDIGGKFPSPVSVNWRGLSREQYWEGKQ